MRILGDLRARITKDPAGTAAAVLAALVFLAVAVYAFGSDIRELACNRLQDDSFYYLQSAWNFSRSGRFTFDGEHPTYGFQPLWMIVLAMLARVSPDKFFFLRASVALGGLFFSLTGWMLFRLARHWTGGGRALIAPVLWTANFSLLGVYITGKENALYAFLLVFACLRIIRRMTSSGKEAWWDGILLGLLVLSRLNALIPAILLLAVLGMWGAGSRAERARSMLAAGVGMLAVIALWCVYAQISFGAIFPSSGTAKLFGANAALAVFLENHLPFLPQAWIEAFVPQAERVLLARPDLLVLPSKDLGFSYLAGLLPELVYGSWAEFFAFLGPMEFRIKVLALAAIGIGAAGRVLLQLRSSARAGAAVLGVIWLSAAGNSLLNWLLMPEYLLWGIWYAVPETLALVLVVAYLVDWPLDLAARVKPAVGTILRTAGAAAVTVLAAAGLALVWIRLAPGDYTIAPDGTQQEAYDAAAWMNENLPPGARVGSFSAGLLGYFGRAYTVINLDGLANTPQFASRELVGHLLYVRGLAPVDPLREYLARENIGWLANVDTVERIARGEYLGLVDPGGGVLLYQGEYAIFWGPADPERRMIVARMDEA
ncbi:MAG: hypothetical protein JW748_03960 [Anaerolineales bacterium]|nr:hypothetical protein [Anaerolineales bacterium]